MHKLTPPLSVDVLKPAKFDLKCGSRRFTIVYVYYPMHATLKFDDTLLGLLEMADASERQEGLLLTDDPTNTNRRPCRDYRVISVDRECKFIEA